MPLYKASHIMSHIAGKFFLGGGDKFVIFGVQFQARNLKPTKVSTCVLRPSVRYLSHEIKKKENQIRGPFKEVTKIASPENYRLYGILTAESLHRLMRRWLLRGLPRLSASVRPVEARTMR